MGLQVYVECRSTIVHVAECVDSRQESVDRKFIFPSCTSLRNRLHAYPQWELPFVPEKPATFERIQFWIEQQ